MSASQSENGESTSGYELVPTSGMMMRNMQSTFHESQGEIPPEMMIRIAMFVNVQLGRICFRKASKAADEILRLAEEGKASGITVDAYHFFILSSVLKKRLQMHDFYSKHLVGLVEESLKRRKGPISNLMYKRDMKKSVIAITDVAIELQDIIAKEHKLYKELLVKSREYPIFLSDCLMKINDYKSALKEQVVNQELKDSIEENRDKVRFFGEVCSRLLVVTPLTTRTLINAFLKTQTILNLVNGIGTNI